MLKRALEEPGETEMVEYDETLGKIMSLPPEERLRQLTVYRDIVDRDIELVVDKRGVIDDEIEALKRGKK
jgi:hypothetical protein